MIYPSLPNLFGNLMCAIDIECTGVDPSYHEIVQIAVVPVDHEFYRLKSVTPFYTELKPLYPERAEPAAMHTNKLDLNELCLHALHPDTALDRFVEWFDRLELPMNRSIVPLAHNWFFESGFLRAWMGHDLYNKMFFAIPRDSMVAATMLNDKASFAGVTPPFRSVSLPRMCDQLEIMNEKPHDAYHDALACAILYKRLLAWENEHVL